MFLITKNITLILYVFGRKLSSDEDQNLLPNVTWSQITDISSVVMDTCQKCLKKLGETYQHKVFMKQNYIVVLYIFLPETALFILSFRFIV